MLSALSPSPRPPHPTLPAEVTRGGGSSPAPQALAGSSRRVPGCRWVCSEASPAVPARPWISFYNRTTKKRAGTQDGWGVWKPFCLAVTEGRGGFRVRWMCEGETLRLRQHSSCFKAKYQKPSNKPALEVFSALCRERVLHSCSVPTWLSTSALWSPRIVPTLYFATMSPQSRPAPPSPASRRPSPYWFAL